jgi:hypothetical protein
MMASAIRLYEKLGFKRAYETDLRNGDTLVKGYRLDLLESSGDNGEQILAAGTG